MIGTKLAHYEITSHLGSGGMGDVYQATDSKLGRSVAIKLLPEAFIHDTERAARFEREARVLASLNHPNIAAIHGIEESCGRKFLVMELVPGETLAERIKRGPIPVNEALDIAKQIAEALEAAHDSERAIIHRDLKPANVKVTPDGKIKILDFGLAKAYEGQSANANLSQSPTLSMAATNAGVILGTAAYMSPEQAKGRQVDKRTDIWAFGCLLYEMLTGQQTFTGETVSDILASVLKSEPEWSLLPSDTPSDVQTLLRRCLRKDANRRPRSAADISLALDDVLNAPVVSVSTSAISPQPASLFWQRITPWGAGILVGALVTGLGAWLVRPSEQSFDNAVAQLAIPLMQGDELGGGRGRPSIAVSPDGKQFAYIAAQSGEAPRLYIRSLESQGAKALPGTEGAENPFFSPDGQWIAFIAQGKLKKVSMKSGALQTICECNAFTPRGGSWGPNDTIFISPGGALGIVKVSAAGGQAEAVTTLDRARGEVSHRMPQVLPGGRALLYTVWTGPGDDEKEIQIFDLKSGEVRRLVKGGHSGRYVPTGHLIYSRGASLLAAPFDLNQLELSDESPASLLDGIGGNGEGSDYAISNSGMLAYVPGNPGAEVARMVWVDRSGRIDALPSPHRDYGDPRISPDGRRIAVSVSGGVVGLWIFDLVRSTLTPFTSEGSSQAPQWIPDGKRIVYRGTRNGFRNIYWRPSDGSGTEARLTTGEITETPTGLTPDGKQLLMVINSDIWSLPMPTESDQADSDHKPMIIQKSPFNEVSATVSRDGRWFAYSSSQSGQAEVYVQPFPGPGERSQVSINGGAEPVWARDGRELFYRNGNQMMAVNVATQPSFSAGKPHLLFEGNYRFSPTATPDYDVSPDGKRFLMIQSTEQTNAPTQINVVLNWFAELKQKVPTAK